MHPTLFISHGAPNMILQDSLLEKNLKNITNEFGKAKYIIMISAHYVKEELKVINYEANSLMYDFYGFEKELYDFKYEIKSDKNLTYKLVKNLQKENIKVEIDNQRKSFDHGVWSVLSMMYKKLDIPVIQLSVPLSYSSKKLIDLGECLKNFKNEAMIICSGGITHNLKDMSFSSKEKTYAVSFNEKIKTIIEKGNKEALIKVKKEALFSQNHPTPEHFLPLYIAFGSAFDKKGLSFNSQIVLSNISLESFVFDKKE